MLKVRNGLVDDTVDRTPRVKDVVAHPPGVSERSSPVRHVGTDTPLAKVVFDVAVRLVQGFAHLDETVGPLRLGGLDVDHLVTGCRVTVVVSGKVSVSSSGFEGSGLLTSGCLPSTQRKTWHRSPRILVVLASLIPTVPITEDLPRDAGISVEPHCKYPAPEYKPNFNPRSWM